MNRREWLTGMAAVLLPSRPAWAQPAPASSEFLVTETMRISSGTILDPRMYGRVWRAAPTLRGPMIAYVGDPNLAEREIQGIAISDLRLIGNGQCDGIWHAADRLVSGSNPRSIAIARVRIENCARGLVVERVEGGHIVDCKLIRNTVGLEIGEAAAGVHVDTVDFRHNEYGILSGRVPGVPSNEWLWSRVHLESHTNLAVWLRGVRNHTFLRCKFEDNLGHIVLDFPPGTTDISQRPDGHKFDGLTLNATRSGAVGIDVKQGNNLLFDWCAATAPSKLATAIRIGGPAGWHSIITGKMIKASQVSVPNKTDGRWSVLSVGLAA